MARNYKQEGITKWFDAEKGYGFISRDGQPDLFVHYSGIIKHDQGRVNLFEGDKVTFEVGKSEKDGRPCAIECEVTEAAQQA